MSKSRWLRLLALLLGLSMLAAACGDDDDTEGGATGETDTETDADGDGDGGEAAAGGDLVIGAEQEPDCVDWISSCAASSWGYWMMGATTMPRAFDVVKDGEEWVYEPSILLDGEPELTEDPQTVTYQISEDAVWSDGEPITSSDFKFTWDAIATGDDIYDTTGYANIESVDDSDPKVAVVTFTENYAGWQGLFGGGYGIYPSHLLEGEDHLEVMGNGYDFSGGPWMIEAWDKGVEVVLVPNENYWGEVPELDSVTFRFVTDTAAQFQAYQAGEVEMIYPQPQLDVVDAIEAGIEGSSAYSANTGNFEALWLNNSAFPLDSVVVRQALAYSLDRDAIVEALFGGIGVTEASQGLSPPILSQFSDTESFAGYTLDLEKVDELMTGDGWEKNGDGIWEKDGQAAKIDLVTTAGNARRELTQQVVQEQASEAGFDITISSQEAGTLFGEMLPNGDFQMGLYSGTANTLDPIAPNLFHSENIPSEANEFSGVNLLRVNIPEVDPLLETLQNSLDDEERREAGTAADAILAENAVSIPLDPLPNIMLWSDNIEGDVVDNPIHGPFNMLHTWSLAG